MRNIFDDVKTFRKRAEIKVLIDPDRVSGISVLLSFLVIYFILTKYFIYASIALFFVLFLDFLDGAIARGRKIRSYKGQITDWAADRISEAIIFTPLILVYKPLVLLLILNIFLNFLVVKKKLTVLPIRHVILIWLVYMSYF